MKSKPKCALVLIALGLLLQLNLACKAQSDADIEKLLSQLDNGKVVGNVYENKLFGLKIKFPTTMAPDPKDAIAGDVKDAIEGLKTGKAKDQKVIDEMIRKERIIFTLDLPESNDSIGAAMSLTIKKDETKEDLKPMVDRSIQFFVANGKQKLLSGPSEESLGILSVVSFSLSMKNNGATVFSKIYCTRRSGYLLTFSIVYADDKSFSEMETVLKGIAAI